MSLIRIAARIAAVEALKGNTLVGDNVLDSEIGAFSQGADGTTRTDEDRPFIAVYTDGSENKDNALRSMSVNGMTDFIFESGVTTTMTVTDPDTLETVVMPGIPATDKAFEFYLDMIARQIADTLTNPDNAWAEVFRGLTSGVQGIKRARTSSDASGVRLAGQQITVSAVLVNEPVRGAVMAVTHPLAKFFALAADLEGTAVAKQIAMMQDQLAGTVSDYKVMQQRFGRTSAEARSTGLEVVGGPIVAGVNE